MAGRARSGRPPWDRGCTVEPLIGGWEFGRRLRDDLEHAIRAARRSRRPPGRRGHLYVAGWRFDPLRDHSEENPWGTSRWWMPSAEDSVRDQTNLGFLLRAMQAGLLVRVLLWHPFAIDNLQGFRGHLKNHAWLARAIARENARLRGAGLGGTDGPLGVVGLDMRLPRRTACHHQKIVVLRVPGSSELDGIDVAYVGGIDLAVTRRDAPDREHPYDPRRPQFLGGDWQSGPRPWSGKGVPPPGGRRGRLWPGQQNIPEEMVDYSSLEYMGRPPTHHPPDLSDREKLGSALLYGAAHQYWHDQHLRMQGPVVETIEETFLERWSDSAGRIRPLGRWRNSFWSIDQVLFGSEDAIEGATGQIRALPRVEPVGPTGTSLVQVWRTVPVRPRRHGPNRSGEFTIMAGIAHACARARERIWIFDQYFWNLPLARLLNARLRAVDSLRLVLVLPPWSDMEPSLAATREDYARRLALDALTEGLHREEADGLPDRVAVFDLWHPGQQRGIYVHAKAQIYDGTMLVCGTANLCRRSFSCDTEIDCAVVDPKIVEDHERRLWSSLFPAVEWPREIAGGVAAPGSGARFFQAFRAAAASAGAFLTPDPWRSFTPTLPNGAQRHQHPLAFGRLMYDRVVDPTGLPSGVELPEPDARGPSWPRVDEVVDRVARFRRTGGGRGSRTPG